MREARYLPGGYGVPPRERYLCTRFPNPTSVKTLLTAALLIASVLAGFRASAQDETVVDRFDLRLSGAWGGWHTQLTNLGGGAVFQGGYGGLEFNKTIFIGWGVFRLQDVVRFDDGLTARDVDFRYHGPQLYYTPLARSVLHPKFGLQTGFGRVSVEGAPDDRIAVLLPFVGGEVNVLRWARLGVDLGYRFALNTASGGPGDGFVSGVYGQAALKFGFSWGGGSTDGAARGG